MSTIVQITYLDKSGNVRVHFTPLPVEADSILRAAIWEPAPDPWTTREILEREG
jgi:hypothetical protein